MGDDEIPPKIKRLASLSLNVVCVCVCACVCMCVHSTFEPSVSDIALRMEDGNGLVRIPPNALRVGPASLLHNREKERTN